MQGWVLMEHDTYADYTQAYGHLIGKFYSDIESVCRVIADDPWANGEHIVNIEYDNGGAKALLTSSKGKLFSAHLMVMPMREDVPTKW